MKIKAAVAYAASRPLVVEEIDLEGPWRGEVPVKLAATGVCHAEGTRCRPQIRKARFHRA